MDPKSKMAKRYTLLKKQQELTDSNIIVIGTIGFSKENHFGTKYDLEKTVGRYFMKYSKIKMPSGMFSLMEFGTRDIVYRGNYNIERIVTYDNEKVDSWLDKENTIHKYYEFYDYIAKLQDKLRGQAFKLRWLCSLFYENKVNYLDWKQQVRVREEFLYPEVVRINKYY